MKKKKRQQQANEWRRGKRGEREMEKKINP
jgi:hypothetical protein